MPHDAGVSEPRSIRIVLADDHAIVRGGVKLLINAQPDMEVVGEAEDGLQAIAITAEAQPDVVIMDITMPRINGLAATRRIHRLHPGIGIIALTMHDDVHYFYEMVQAGGSGYVLKDAPEDQLLEAVRAAAEARPYLAPSVASRLAQDHLSPAVAGSGLTPREQEVLALVAEGLTNREIADRLVVSIKTVETHRTNLMQKLDLHDRTDLVKYAIRKGLISLDEGDDRL